MKQSPFAMEKRQPRSLYSGAALNGDVPSVEDVSKRRQPFLLPRQKFQPEGFPVKSGQQQGGNGAVPAAMVYKFCIGERFTGQQKQGAAAAAEQAVGQQVRFSLIHRDGRMRLRVLACDVFLTCEWKRFKRIAEGCAGQPGAQGGKHGKRRAEQNGLHREEPSQDEISEQQRDCGKQWQEPAQLGKVEIAQDSVHSVPSFWDNSWVKNTLVPFYRLCV